jgi:hypothetical protein
MDGRPSLSLRRRAPAGCLCDVLFNRTKEIQLESVAARLNRNRRKRPIAVISGPNGIVRNQERSGIEALIKRSVSVGPK